MQPDEPMSARDEIRVTEFGLLRCPSCGELAAELLGRHCLTYEFHGEAGSFHVQAECRDGGAIGTRDYDVIIAITNIALADEVWFRETIALREAGLLPAGPPGGFTGLLGVPRDEP